ncbi:MAG TPA: hypothetical protein VI612_03750 [Candidatus Nanoarchaeia archaeon]|nr:hypothetical protein [Candidatus Nanoarchaeia archaeon]
MFARKGMTPLVATILLVAFSVGLGALVMSWGEDYIEQKAEFVQGVQEVKSGCDAVSFELIKIGGQPQACRTADTIELWIDNGPNMDLYNIHARVAGKDGVSVSEEILKTPLLKENSVKASVPYDPTIGQILQVKLTPKISSGDTAISCTEKPLNVEYIPVC